jgi:hypothetical protein
MSTWMLKQWPVPLVAATALVMMLAAQRIGVTFSVPAYFPEARADANVAKVERLPGCKGSARSD